MGKIKSLKVSTKIGKKKQRKHNLKEKEWINKGENLDQKKRGHNREPAEQSYYCGSGSFMGFSCWLLFTLGSLVFIFVKYMFLAKAKRKGMDEKENMTIWAKKVGHNREPTEQTYYWGSRWLMCYPLEKLFGCNVLIRL